jgi:peptide/nickel transport system ATP-binding protein
MTLAGAKPSGAPASSMPPSAAAPALLAAHGITVASAGVAVLRDLAFTVRRGCILGVIGESGAGKTMIGRVIANQLPPSFRVTAGELRFDGRDILTLSAAAHRELLGRRIAFVPQEPMSALNPVLTIGHHFAEHLARLGVPRAERRAAAAAALADVRLPSPEEALDKYPFQLSGGMCQRVLIALAFASNPDLVVADEPTAAVDATTQVHIVALLRRLQAARGTGVLFITHDLRLAGHLCDEVAVLYAGDLVEHGPVRAVLGNPLHPYTRALERANPPITGPPRPLASPPSHMPGLGEFPGLRGCRFVPRCASATAACASAAPPLRAPAGGRVVRCLHEGALPLAEGDDRAAAAHGSGKAAAPLLAVEGIAKSYRRPGSWLRARGELLALKDVSFVVNEGEFVGVVGESGSGKSTLGRLIMGLEPPTAGRVMLDREALGHGGADWSRRVANIQLIFQDPRSALNPRRRVMQLVTQAIDLRSLGRHDRVARATALMRDTGLPADLMMRYSRQMSGGQRQRVNIARAICARPRLLIADEIVSGLDVSVQAQILNLLLKLRREYGIALLMISHDLAVIRYLCSRVLVMCRGEIVESGPTERVFSAPEHAYTRQLLAAVPSEDLSRAWPSPG